MLIQQRKQFTKPDKMNSYNECFACIQLKHIRTYNNKLLVLIKKKAALKFKEFKQVYRYFLIS